MTPSASSFLSAFAKADGYSNAAIAEKLEASDSTVRTHLRSINTKFAARSRAEAVAIGRRLGVIR